ncbi:MAG: pyridoxal phosphate-dependent aminotransferase [Alphaproteobacteria bacterium]|nr:pyridoxal phosphate-dependent aminotransferase [Alphaproteobacteria bacterium]
MTVIRPAILALERNGIGEVSMLGLGRTDIIPLWFGEGDIVTPDFIRDAAKRALDQGKTFYTFTRGLTELREAIAAWASRQSGRTISLDRVTVPGAAMMGVQIALQCVCEPGDNVLIVSPMWPNIFQAVRGLGAEPRFVRLSGGANGEPWTLDLERLFAAADRRTKAVFFASPSNPTGWIMSEREQRAILDFARKRGIAVISDEVYTPIVYDTPAPSFAAIADPEDDVFVVNSFSKAWAMTGWRVGWLLHPPRLGTQMAEMAAYNNTGSAVFAQYGALEAITKGDAFVKWQLDRCREGLAIVEKFVASQNRISWSKPAGAFYGFLAVDGMTDSTAFAKRLLEEAKVGVAPGIAFGPKDDRENDRFIRICFAQDPKRLSEALDRIARHI